MKYKDETGNKYGKLLVLEKLNYNSKSGSSVWLCQCDCGNLHKVVGASLRNGSTKSCGCFNGNTNRSGEAIYKNLYRLIRSQSRKRGIYFDLTLEQYKELVHKNCEYCGQKPYIKKYAYHKTRYSKGINTDEVLILNGIDKVIPSLGYTINNCVPCCKYCNRAKSDLSLNDFKDLIIKIYKNLNLDGKCK